MLKQYAFVVVAVVSSALLLGCGDSEKTPTDKTGGKTKNGKTVDPHDIPMTDQEKDQLKASIKDYQAALTRIKSYRDKIRTETTSGDPRLAHRSLDELDLVLGWLPEIAEKSGVPKAKLEDLTKTAQQLQDLFNKVHAEIDAHQKPDYAAVANDIEAGIKKLEGFTADNPKE
jgi:prefoldin subunit 5